MQTAVAARKLVWVPELRSAPKLAAYKLLWVPELLIWDELQGLSRLHVSFYELLNWTELLSWLRAAFPNDWQFWWQRGPDNIWRPHPLTWTLTFKTEIEPLPHGSRAWRNETPATTKITLQCLNFNQHLLSTPRRWYNRVRLHTPHTASLRGCLSQGKENDSLTCMVKGELGPKLLSHHMTFG